MSGGDPYDVLDAVFTALSPPLVLEVVVRFAGELRRRRSVRVLAGAFFGGLALASLGALFSIEVAAWNDGTSRSCRRGVRRRSRERSPRDLGRGAR